MKLKLIFTIGLLLALAACLPLMAADTHAVILTGGVWVDLGSIAGEASAGRATAINNSGLVAGECGDPLACSFTSGVGSAVPGLPAEPHHSSALAVNAGGSLVGCSSMTSDPLPGGCTAFIYNGSTTAYLAGAGVSSVAYGINDSSTIVGTYNTGTGNYRAFIYSGGTLTPIPGTGDLSYAYAINSSGLAVGLFYICVPIPDTDPPQCDPQRHLFTYSSPTFTDLGYPGNPSGLPLVAPGSVDNWNLGASVNDSNVISFTYGGAPFYYDGTFHQIPLLMGDSVSNAGGISGSGVVIGWSRPSNHPWQYVIGSSTLTDLGLSKTGGGNWTGVQPTGINSSGQVVGFAY